MQKINKGEIRFHTKASERYIDVIFVYDKTPPYYCSVPIEYRRTGTEIEGILPDHKFPEIRWDEETRRNTLENLSEKEIKNDFQLLTNQRNQQIGIPYFYKGTMDWYKRIPQHGKDAEKGCIGCGWYDIECWRQELAKKLKLLG